MENSSKLYCIIDVKDIDKINFSEVMETRPDSLRLSVDGTKTFVKYRGDQPEFIYSITKDAVGLSEYNHQQILEILNEPEWNSQG
jgi:hypothetical protein